jgi:DNA polymerase-1
VKIFLLDSNGIICRYFYAMPELFTEDGVMVNGLFGYCRLIKDIISKYKKEEFAIVATFDRCSKNFRKDIAETYKQNRKPADSSLIVQLNLAEQFCRNVSIPVEFHLNYEADDIIASLAEEYGESSEIFILTTDKDLMQLVKNNVKILNPFTKEIFDRDGVKKKLGVFPEDVDLFLALCGDSSDNIPGIKGIGPKTAINILSKTKDPAEMQKLFPKFDFSLFEHMLSLTRLFKNYKSEKVLPFKQNSSVFNENLRLLNFNSFHS